MSTPPVYWHQGMFLRPHHFQAAERYWAGQVRTAGRFDVHYNWGGRVIRIDPDALKNFRFVVDRVEARLRDGTLVVAERGTDQALNPVDLKPVMEQVAPGGTVDVFLAVPTLQLGRANTGRPGDARTRYLSEPSREPTEDENDGRTPSLVEFRRLNLRVLTSLEDATGYETVPLARLERSTKATGEPQIHEWYIPPVLATDGWPPLADGVIGHVYNRVGGMVKQLARSVKDQGIRFDTNNPEQKKLFERLRALNEAYAVLSVLAQAGGVHPFAAYLELCRLAGTLAVFGREMSLPEGDGERLLPYDHDDLGACFFRVKRYLDDLLTQDFDQGYEVRPFVGDGLRLKVRIEPSWLAPACQLLVGVKSPLTNVECARLLTGRLNMKIGALERVDEVFRVGARGLDFVHDHKPPPVLPAEPELTYFRINREVSKDEWAAVSQTYNLAIRMNQTLVIGSSDGRPDVTLQTDGKTSNLRFTLYVVMPSAQQG